MDEEGEGEVEEEGEDEVEESDDARSWDSVCYKCKTKDKKTKRGVELLACDGLGDNFEKDEIEQLEILKERARCRHAAHLSCADLEVRPAEDEAWHCEDCLKLYNLIRQHLQRGQESSQDEN